MGRIKQAMLPFGLLIKLEKLARSKTEQFQTIKAEKFCHNQTRAANEHRQTHLAGHEDFYQFD